MNSHLLYNPKATAPAIYIPAWLSQVPNHELNYSSKLVYGRLAQWANHSGKAHRSAKQLSEEIGMPTRTVESCLQELREQKLIGCYVPSDGGHNHFEFYHHEWMNRPISPKLCYLSAEASATAISAEATAISAEATAISAVHKIKEIKEIKNTKILSSATPRTKKYKASDYEKDDRFMRFYSAYPIHKKGAHAYKMWLRLNPDDDMLEMMMNDVQNRLTNDSQWLDGCIPHPGTYLNPECPGFKDDIVNRDKIKHEAKQAREAQQKEQAHLENEARIKAQDEQHKKTLDRERHEQHHIDADGKAFRKLKKNPELSSEASTSLKNLRNHVGLK